MTITIEQLELAAKAAGINIVWLSTNINNKVSQNRECFYRDTSGIRYPWNPLSDHGQLHDLAMACGIDLMPSVGGIRYWTKRQPTEVIWVKVDCHNFPALAEAVILAASEMEQAKCRT